MQVHTMSFLVQLSLSLVLPKYQFELLQRLVFSSRPYTLLSSRSLILPANYFDCGLVEKSGGKLCRL